MRIRRLAVENVRSIDKAELKDLGSIIVIAGPNGSGKSSLLDAIRLFKSAHGVYSNRGAVLERQYPEFITVGRDTATIEMEIDLTKEERDIIGITSPTLQGKVTISRPLRPAPSGNDIPALGKLFSTSMREYEKLGKIDHIPPDRRFAKGSIPSVSFDRGSLEREWQRMVDDTTEKFATIKSDLWRMNYADMEATVRGITPHPQYMHGIQKAFQDLLGDVEFVGISSSVQAPPKFLIRTPRGQHEMDVLSSGQAEVLMVFSHLERHKFMNSVILFDGPELYLNAAIEKKMIKHLRRLAEQGNQLWIATHSPEIINSCDEETIYRLSGGSPNTVERIDTRDERIKTFEALGATLSSQLISKLIVYVEGESDKDILTCFEPDIPRHVHFISSEGVKPLGKVLELLNKATKFENFRAIRDRDTLNDEEIEKLERNSNNRLFIWKRHEIENYLLDAQALFKVLEEHPSIKCRTTLKDSNEVEAELKQIADDLKGVLVARILERRLNDQIFRRVKIDPKDIEKSFKTICDRRLPMVQRLETGKLRDLEKGIRKKIETEWHQNWIKLCSGKDVLQEFSKRHIRGHVSTILPILIEFLAKKIAVEDRIPPDVKSVIAMMTD